MATLGYITVTHSARATDPIVVPHGYVDTSLPWGDMATLTCAGESSLAAVDKRCRDGYCRTGFNRARGRGVH